MSAALQSIRDQIKNELANLKRTYETPGVPRIKTAGKRFTLPDGTSSNGPVQLIILDYVNVRSYYENIYNENNPTPPVCFALSKTLDDLAPDPGSPKPQNDTCKGCRKDEYDSSPTGRGGKACKNAVRLAVVPVDFADDADPYALDISPTGLPSWGRLLASLASSQSLPVNIVTEVYFAPEVSYSSLRFRPLQENPRLEEAWALRERAAALLSTHPHPQ